MKEIINIKENTDNSNKEIYNLNLKEFLNN